MQAQPFAIFAARDLQAAAPAIPARAERLPAAAVTLIIADLGFRVGDRKLVAASIRAERTVQQFELSRLTSCFTGSRQRAHSNSSPVDKLPTQADVLNDFVLAVMLFDQSRRGRRSSAASSGGLHSPRSMTPGWNSSSKSRGCSSNSLMSRNMANSPRRSRRSLQQARGSTPRGVSTARSKT